MKVELNQTLKSFRELLANHSDLNGNDRVIANGRKVIRGHADVGWSKRSEVRQLNGLTQTEQNNYVRTILLRALREQFTSGIPDSVRRALVGSGKYGADDMTEKNGKVTSGRPLTMRRVRAVIEAVESEIRKVSNQNEIAEVPDVPPKEKTSAPTDNLRSGLLAADTTVAGAESLNALLDGLKIDADIGRLLQDKTEVSLQAKHKALLEAQNACQQARDGLKGLSGKDLADRVNGARERLAAAVEAEADLAEKITSLAGEIRKSLKKVPSEAVVSLLGQLDDLAMSSELNAARIERLGAELMELKDDEALNRLTSEFEDLVRGAAPQEDDVRAAQAAIEKYVTVAQPLLDEIARLETLPPDAETAEIAARLEKELVNAENALADLSGPKGVDPEAVRQLRANLAAARRTLATCGGKIREKMLEGMSRELEQMLKDCLPLLDGCPERLRGIAGELKSFINDNWASRLPADSADELKKFVDEVCGKIGEWKDDPGWDPLLSKSGLGKFGEKCEALKAFLNDNAPDAPFSLIDAKLLGQALRGEIDVMNYLSLKNAGYTDEMFWADLVVKPGSQKESVGSGSFNEVHKLEMTNVRTGATETVVLKDVELTGAMSKHSVGGLFSSDEQASQTDKINVATSKAATLIGCGRQITRCGMVHVGDRYQLAQEMAPGKTVSDAVEKGAPVFEMPDPKHPGQRKRVNFYMGYESLPSAAKEQLKVELQLAAAKLEWADLLTGQLDRSRKNMMIKFNVTGTGQETRVEVVLKGIDNDIGFTEGHKGLFQFEIANGKKKDGWEKPGFDATKAWDLKNLVKKAGVHGFRIPAFLPLSVKRRLDMLDEATFRREMKGLIEGKALDAAVGRLKDLKKLANIMVREGRIIDDIDRANTASAKTLSAFVRQNCLHKDQRMHTAIGNIYAEFFSSDFYSPIFLG